MRLPSVALLALCGPALAQDQAIAARFLLLGESAVVTRDELAQEMAARQRRTDEGQAALENLIDLELVRQAAREQGVMPDDRALDAWIPQLAAQMRAGGLDLEDKLASLGMTAAEFREYAAIQLAHIQLVRKELGLGPRADVDGDMLRLWLAQARRQRQVVTDESALPAGCVARVGRANLLLVDLGRLLTKAATPEKRAEFVERIVRERCVRALAEREKIEVTDADIDAEIAARRRLAEANPRLQGLSFEKFLESIGTNVAELRRATVFAAQIRERKLIEALYPPAELDRRLREERAAIERRHGEQRRLDVLLVRADRGRSAEQAEQQARTLRAAIESGTEFREVALEHSEDPYTRVSGGDAGWHHRDGSTLPDPVVAAGFAAELDEVVGPVQAANGCYLVRVRAIEPTPEDAVLRTRLRDALQREKIAALLAEAGIEVLR